MGKIQEIRKVSDWASAYSLTDRLEMTVRWPTNCRSLDVRLAAE